MGDDISSSLTQDRVSIIVGLHFPNNVSFGKENAVFFSFSIVGRYKKSHWQTRRFEKPVCDMISTVLLKVCSSDNCSDTVLRRFRIIFMTICHDPNDSNRQGRGLPFSGMVIRVSITKGFSIPSVIG